MISYRFPGKVVLVTGSSRGIGAGLINQFAHAGATCLINYWPDPDGANLRDAEELAGELATSAPAPHPRLFPADVTNPAQIEAMMTQIKSEFGGLDVLVNNAGILKDRSLKKMAVADWDAVIDTNLSGVFHCCKFGTEILRDGGRIINIASVAGLVGIFGQANYAAAKAGVIGLTRVLAKELAKRGITANAIAPGVVQTPMMGEIKPEMLAEYLKQIPVGRLATTADIANVVLFLASEETGYVTGQVVPVTGGWLV